MTPTWKRWFRLSRVVPLLTLILGIVAGFLALLNLFPYERTNGFILVVLGLLTVDSLIERLGLLERLETKLNSLTLSRVLVTRDQLPDLAVDAKNAKEICILATSGSGLLQKYQPFLERKVSSGCRLRILLFNPSTAVLQEQAKLEALGDDLKTTIDAGRKIIEGLQSMGKTRFELRSTTIKLPFSMVMIDSTKLTGYMTVEFHGYKTHPSERPSIVLKAAEEWFEYFRKQFEDAWKDNDPN